MRNPSAELTPHSSSNPGLTTTHRQLTYIFLHPLPLPLVAYVRVGSLGRNRAFDTDTQVTALPEVGYFQDQDNYGHTTGFPGGPNSPQWAMPVEIPAT